MPTISEFFGIIVRMYYNDHLPPHFHAYYAEAELVYAIQTLEVLEGGLPQRAHNLDLEWASEHRAELLADWNQARRSEPLLPTPAPPSGACPTAGIGVPMLIRAQNVQPLADFRVRVVFTDGTTREFDLAPYLHGPIFEPVRRQPELFRTVRVEFGALTWPNGADIDPDVLYHAGPPAWASQPDQPSAARG